MDHYTWTRGVFTNPREGVRQVLKRLPPRAAEHVVDALVDTLFPVHWRLREVRALHGPLCLVSPLLLYFRSHPQLTRAQHEALTRLDTFDALTDRYKHRRTQGQIESALRALGAVDVEVWRGGNGVEARARRPE